MDEDVKEALAQSTQGIQNRDKEMLELDHKIMQKWPIAQKL